MDKIKPGTALDLTKFDDMGDGCRTCGIQFASLDDAESLLAECKRLLEDRRRLAEALRKHAFHGTERGEHAIATLAELGEVQP